MKRLHTWYEIKARTTTADKIMVWEEKHCAVV